MSFNPKDLSWQSPLLTEAGRKMLIQLREHPDAPYWNVHTGDRLSQEDLLALKGYAKDLKNKRCGQNAHQASSMIIDWLKYMHPRVPLFQRNIPQGADLEQDWAKFSPMTREDIALRIGEVVPEDADLDKLIKYGTSGTTGHPIMVPHEPRAVAHYQVLIEHVLSLYGIELGFTPESVAAFEVCAQQSTVTFATVLSVWNQAGFAKINLNPKDWPQAESPERYFSAMKPQILTGDPISFAKMVELQIPTRPQALISTALALTPGLRARLEKYFQCPLIDWYSLNETGPIGYTCSANTGYHLLPHDLYVEIIDQDARPLAPGEIGEITVTGGRNPFVPLLRYRTGDRGKLDFSPCSCGDPMPKIVDLEGREPVLFYGSSREIINPVDISRTLGAFPIVQHQFLQRCDYSCQLTLRFVSPAQPADLNEIEQALRPILGSELPLGILIDPLLGEQTKGGKVLAYQSELEPGDI